ncbi:hypothetical protein [Pseudomonas cichorii]|uniref:hypothetical protein n=1 Tax=Pseudomonas cichorii TaxID=36746 RepID=UPI0011C3C83A|nr:hypothetical protein [Pseudomonas cichorii]
MAKSAIINNKNARNAVMENIENQVIPTVEECDAYFNSLPPVDPERCKPRPMLLSGLNDEKKEDDIGKVGKDSPSIIAFADGVSEKNREAVMLGIEFAEAVASSKADIDTDPIEWLKKYTEAMFYAGWQTTGGHEYGSYSTNDKSLTMEAVVLELLASVAGPNAATVIALMGELLGKLGKNDSLMKLFEGNSKKGTLARFRVMPCVESSSGIPVTYLLSMHCEYSSSSGGVLFWKWSVSNLNIRRLAKGVSFSSYSYERNKQRILDYLNGKADDFFEGLKK